MRNVSRNIFVFVCFLIHTDWISLTKCKKWKIDDKNSINITNVCIYFILNWRNNSENFVYNLCVHNGRPSNHAFCYCWWEVDGKWGSIEIATCLYRWLQNLQQEVKEESLYSDSCAGQNRNVIVAALFFFALEELPLEKIIHNFLESGLSYMECDSVYSAMEKENGFLNGTQYLIRYLFSKEQDKIVDWQSHCLALWGSD